MTSGFLWNKKAEKESFRAFSRSLEEKQIWIWKFGLFVISFDSEASNSQFLITVTHFPHSWQLNNLLVSSLWEASKPFSPRKLFPLVWNSESEQFAVLVLVLVHSTRLDEIVTSTSPSWHTVRRAFSSTPCTRWRQAYLNCKYFSPTLNWSLQRPGAGGRVKKIVD